MSSAGGQDAGAAAGVPRGSDYVIGERLGTGPTGEVYAGHDLCGDPVAVKFLNSDLAVDAGVVRRFVDERAAFLALRGPGLVRVRDLVVEDGCALAVVTDLVPGVDLHRALAAIGPGDGGLPAAEACRIAAGVARALAAVHAAGFVHGRVKPENVLLDATVSPPAPRLADAATARLLGDAGTPADDMHALGVLLRGLVGGPAEPGAGADAVPEPVRALLSVLLADDPAARPDSAGAVADVLGVLADDLRPTGGSAAGGGCAAAASLTVVLPDALSPDLPPPPPARRYRPAVASAYDDDAVAMPAPTAAWGPGPAAPADMEPVAPATGPAPSAPAPAGAALPRPARPARPLAPGADRRAMTVGVVCAALVLGATVTWNAVHDPHGATTTAGLSVPVGDPPAAPGAGVPDGGMLPSAAPAGQPTPLEALPGQAAPAGGALTDTAAADGAPQSPTSPAVAGVRPLDPATAGPGAPAGAPVREDGAAATGSGGPAATAAAPAAAHAIAYLSDRDGEWQLYRADSGGSTSGRDKRLTDVDGGVMGPAWSPDARRITYFAVEGGRSVLWVMEADGGNRVRLSDNALRPVFSADGTAIAFEGGWNGALEVFVVNIDGTGLRRLTSDGSATAARWPSWSPDGSRIAYTAYSSVKGVTTGSIRVVNVDGENRHNLAADGVQPAFSPDGRSIAFTRPQGSGHDIYVMAADGSGETRLTRAPGTDWSPTFSPDGRRIMFLSNREDTSAEGYDVYLMDADGSDARRLTAGSRTRSAATFSPDGRQIAYNALTGGKSKHFEIYVVNVDGTGRTRLVERGYGPVWGGGSDK